MQGSQLIQGLPADTVALHQLGVELAEEVRFAPICRALEAAPELPQHQLLSIGGLGESLGYVAGRFRASEFADLRDNQAELLHEPAQVFQIVRGGKVGCLGPEKIVSAVESIPVGIQVLDG